MFTDGRSRRVIFLAHCLLNQNAISDGTAEVPAAHREILQAALDAQAGVVQMPCPELCCLGLDRGDPKGGERPVVVENTRIRRAMGQPEAAARLRENEHWHTAYLLRELFRVCWKLYAESTIRKVYRSAEQKRLALFLLYGD